MTVGIIHTWLCCQQGIQRSLYFWDDILFSVTATTLRSLWQMVHVGFLFLVGIFLSNISALDSTFLKLCKYLASMFSKVSWSFAFTLLFTGYTVCGADNFRCPVWLLSSLYSVNLWAGAFQHVRLYFLRVAEMQCVHHCLTLKHSAVVLCMFSFFKMYIFARWDCLLSLVSSLKITREKSVNFA